MHTHAIRNTILSSITFLLLLAALLYLIDNKLRQINNFVFVSSCLLYWITILVLSEVLSRTASPLYDPSVTRTLFWTVVSAYSHALMKKDVTFLCLTLSLSLSIESIALAKFVRDAYVRGYSDRVVASERLERILNRIEKINVESRELDSVLARSTQSSKSEEEVDHYSYLMKFFSSYTPSVHEAASLLSKAGGAIDATKLAGIVDKEDVDYLLACARTFPNSAGTSEIEALLSRHAQERRSLFEGLKSQSRVLSTLRRFCRVFALFTGLSIFFALKVNPDTVKIVFAILLYLFGSTVMSAITNASFLLLYHAYDVGDKVEVRQTAMNVVGIELFYTEFEGWDGGRSRVSNAVLMGCDVQNVRRSEPQTMRLMLEVSGECKLVQMQNACDLISYSERRKIRAIKLSVGEVVRPGRTVVEVYVQHCSNFHDGTLQWETQNSILEKVIGSFKALGVSCVPSVVPIKIV